MCIMTINASTSITHVCSWSSILSCSEVQTYFVVANIFMLIFCIHQYEYLCIIWYILTWWFGYLSHVGFSSDDTFWSGFCSLVSIAMIRIYYFVCFIQYLIFHFSIIIVSMLMQYCDWCIKCEYIFSITLQCRWFQHNIFRYTQPNNKQWWYNDLQKGWISELLDKSILS